jgi:alpha-glucosidase (family GH31 glycosyl hydrolase)
VFLALALSTAAGVQLPTILPWGANSFRIQYSPPGLPIANSTYSPFLDAPLSTSPFTSSPTTYTNGNLRITVDLETGLFNATRVSDGFVVAQMSSLSFGPPVAKGRYPSSQMEFLGHAQGESLFGMGEQGTTGRVTLEQPFNRDFIQSEYYAFNQGKQAFFPWFISSAGYAMMVAQPGYGWLRVDVAPYFSAYNASSTQTIDFWLTTTPGTPVYAADTPHPFLSILGQYADAVGYAPPMPAFAAGFIASKDRYRNQTQFMEVAHGYVDRGIPLR